MRTLILLLVTLLALAGCTTSPTTITIRGTLEAYEGDQVTLCRSSDRYGYKAWTTTLDTASVGDDGTFAFTFATGETDFYQVIGDKGFALFQDVYLEPGDSLQVHVPVRSDSTRISYAGARAEAYHANDLLTELRRNNPFFAKGYYEMAKMDIDSIRDFISTREIQQTAVIDSHFADHPEWAPIAQTFRDQMTFRAARDRYNYLYYHNYYVNDTFTYLIADSGYYDFLDAIAVNECPEYFSYDYQFFLAAFLRDRIFVDHQELSDSVIYADMMPLAVKTAKTHFSGESRDFAMLSIADDFSRYLAREDFFEQVDSMAAFLAENHTSGAAYEGFMQIKSQFENLRPGNPAPDMALPDINGDTIRLSDMTGKVVYLDFWGTWCFPCLQELPHSLTLQEKFVNDPVEFVYVGLESGEDQLTEWKEFISGERSFDYAPFLEQRVYPGIHLLADGQFGNPAIQPFHIGAAPTYVLIDAAGRIVSANAPRPSSDEIEGMIRETLASNSLD